MRGRQRRRERRREHGGAVVEAALMMPWIAFLFVGVLDFGFYSYAAIGTENAARAAAFRTATDAYSQLDSIACAAALGELAGQANMTGINTCVTTQASVDATHPVAACVATLSNATPPTMQTAGCVGAGLVAADSTVDASAKSAMAVVTYLTLPMVPIPGVLTGQLRLTRIAEVRIGR